MNIPYIGTHRVTVNWPTPTVSEPDVDALLDMMDEDEADATDGCTVEPDGECPHGHPSWLIVESLI